MAKQTEHNEIEALLASASDTKISRDEVLGNLTRIGRALGGTERFEFGRQVYDLLDRRGT